MSRVGVLCPEKLLCRKLPITSHAHHSCPQAPSAHTSAAVVITELTHYGGTPGLLGQRSVYRYFICSYWPYWLCRCQFMSSLWWIFIDIHYQFRHIEINRYAIIIKPCHHAKFNVQDPICNDRTDIRPFIFIMGIHIVANGVPLAPFWGEPMVTDGFPAQKFVKRCFNAGRISMSWRNNIYRSSSRSK